MEEDNTLSITGSYGKEKREFGTTLRPNIVNLMYTGNEMALANIRMAIQEWDIKSGPWVSLATTSEYLLTYLQIILKSSFQNFLARPSSLIAILL